MPRSHGTASTIEQHGIQRSKVSRSSAKKSSHLCGQRSGGRISAKSASCARAAPRSPEEKQAFSKSNCQIQTPSSVIKRLLKNSFSTIFQGPGPGEAPFHFSRFVGWVHYCSKLCQSSSWKPRREASLFQKQLPNSNSKPFPKEPIPY